MANRSFSSNGLSLEKKSVTLWARVAIGASGAPTLQKLNHDTGVFSAAPAGGWAGIKSISRTSAGLYVLTLQDSYVQLLAFWVGFVKDTVATSPIPQQKATGTDVRSLAAPQITFTCYSGSTATDPASGEVMVIEIELADSTSV